MASKLRVEFVRLREKNSNGQQNAVDYGNVAAQTVAVSGTALTGAGRVTCPATVNGYPTYHARLLSDVDVVVTLAPVADATTGYDATLTKAGGFLVLANKEFFLPIVGAQKISAITGPFA